MAPIDAPTIYATTPTYTPWVNTTGGDYTGNGYSNYITIGVTTAATAGNSVYGFQKGFNGNILAKSIIYIPTNSSQVTYCATTDYGSSTAINIQWIVPQGQTTAWYSPTAFGTDGCTIPSVAIIVPDKKSVMLNRIKENLANANPLAIKIGRPETNAEQKARDLLREMVGSEIFADYLRKGALTVVGKTGLRYVIKPGYNQIAVFAKSKDGRYKMFEKLCIVFEDTNIPPTDWLIMRKLLIEYDEWGLRKVAISTPITKESELDLGEAVNFLPKRKVA